MVIFRLLKVHLQVKKNYKSNWPELAKIFFQLIMILIVRKVKFCWKFYITLWMRSLASNVNSKIAGIRQITVQFWGRKFHYAPEWKMTIKSRSRLGLVEKLYVLGIGLGWVVSSRNLTTLVYTLKNSNFIFILLYFCSFLF